MHTTSQKHPPSLSVSYWGKKRIYWPYDYTFQGLLPAILLPFQQGQLKSPRQWADLWTLGDDILCCVGFRFISRAKCDGRQSAGRWHCISISAKADKELTQATGLIMGRFAELPWPGPLCDTGGWATGAKRNYVTLPPSPTYPWPTNMWEEQ